MDVFLCVFFLYSLHMLSVASAAFDFNASLKDVTPESLINVTVYVNRNEKSELLMDFFCVSSFFCLHIQD